MRVSRFSFGTDGLFNAGSTRKRQELLARAFDVGFRHFDTAPYYGFGTAERDLGQLLRSHPEATVATKVGIYSPGGEEAASGSIFIRKAAGRLFPSISRPIIDWSVKRARNALDGSLRRLQRERIDLYLLHEPDPAILDSEEWLYWLEKEQDRVSNFGVAPNSRWLGTFASSKNPLSKIVQAKDSLEACEADVLLQNHRPLQITYGYASAARANGTDIQEVLRRALRRNATGTVIVRTQRIGRLSQYREICDSVDSRPIDVGRA